MNVKYIDDVKEGPIDALSVLTDDQLVDGGLVKVDAYVRTKASKTAMRQDKFREKQAVSGVKQLNVLAPEAAHPVIKQIADRVKSGELVADVLKSLSPPNDGMQGKVLVDPAIERLVEVGRKVESLSGWKRAVAKWLGIV